MIERMSFALHLPRNLPSATGLLVTRMPRHCLQRGIVASSAAVQKGNKRKGILAAVIVTLVTLPAVKIYFALKPLIQELRHPSSSLLRDYGLAEGLNEHELSWRMWLLSNGSDRLIRDVYTVCRIIMKYLQASRTGLDNWDDVHRQSADLLLALCKVNGGVYIKLAQHVGQLDYLLPEQYVQTLRVMCGAAPTDDWESVRSVWRSEMGTDIEEVFAYIDKTPLASASLAQVHVAYLKGTGQKVAVKIQHAGLRQASVADIATVVALAHLVKAVVKDFDYLWLAEETERNLPKELDFLNEAANLQRTQANFAAHRDSVTVPTVIPSLTSHRVLTMSFEQGCYVNDVAAIKAMGLDPKDVAKLVAEAFAMQMFEHGWLHCDPHQANMLVRPAPASMLPGRSAKPQLILLDHGLYRELKPDLRYNYAKLWRSIVMGDERGIAKYAERLGAGQLYHLFAAMLTTRSWDNIMRAADGDLEGLRVTGKLEDKQETAGYVKQYAEGIQHLLRTIPRDLLLVLKTNDCLRSVDNQLGAPLNNYPIIARHCQAALNTKRATSRPGFLTSMQSMWETGALELRLGAMRWAVSIARTVGLWGRSTPGKAKTTEEQAQASTVAIEEVRMQ